jgi:hypothetical protein
MPMPVHEDSKVKPENLLSRELFPRRMGREIAKNRRAEACQAFRASWILLQLSGAK